MPKLTLPSPDMESIRPRSPDEATTVIIRYGELGLKSPRVRRRFEDRLRSNIESLFIHERTECSIEQEHGRLYLFANDIPRSLELLQRIFGIVSFSPTLRIKANLELVATRTADVAEKAITKAGRTFAIRGRRTGTHAYSSMDVNIACGSAVMDRLSSLDISVDLDEPDHEIFVEVRGNRAYIFTDVIAGPGGLPLGSSGKAVTPITGPNSVLAAYLLMKRGVKVVPIVPTGWDRDASPDELPSEERNISSYLASLKFWDVNSRPYVADTLDTAAFLNEGDSVQSMDEDAQVELGRSCGRLKAKAIIVDTVYETFCTASSFPTEINGYPVFLPLIGLIPSEIEHRLAKAL